MKNEKKTGRKDDKKKRDGQQGIFADKRIVLVISLLLAVLSWVIVAGFIKPGDYKVIPNVAIDYTRGEDAYLDQNLQIVSDLSAVFADVEVNGDGSVIGPLTNTSVSVYADYSEVKSAGPHEVPIRVSKLVAGDYTTGTVSVSDGVHSVSNPKTRVTIVFEEVESEQFPITVQAAGVTAAEGFVLDAPVAHPDTVYISGPKNQVDRVAGVAANVTAEEELSERKKYTDIPLTLLDASGIELDPDLLGLELTVDEVDVDIAILEVRTLNLTVDFINIPSNLDVEWFYNRVYLSQNTMRVIGSPAAFENVENPLPVGTYDVTQLELGWETTANITLPGDLRSYDALRQVTVSFNTAGMAERIIEVPLDNVSVVNSPQNATITPLEDTVSVKLLGDEDQIAALLPGNIAIQIDASGVAASRSGQQTIPASVLVPGSDAVFAVGSYPMVCTVSVS